VETNGSVYLIASLLSGLIALLVSTALQIFYNRRIFRLQSFELFRREFDSDSKLLDASERFGEADQPVPDDFIETFLNFFETVGYYHAKNIVHRALVSCTFADDILDAYKHSSTSRFINKTREEARNQHYYEWFLYMARWCQLQEDLEKASGIREWFQVRFIALPSMALRRRWELYRLWFGPTRRTAPVPPERAGSGL
jgi:hypothetical protein